MSMVSIWTPVKYDIQSTTRWQKAREWVDEYFNLGGEIVVVCGKELNGVELMTLQPGKTVRWQTALKAASYTAFLFFRAANRLFPRLPLIPGVVVVQTVISCLPIAMLVMKAVLRFKSHFYRYKDNPNDLIRPQIKVTLDELLGSYGSVDQLPVYECGEGEFIPSVVKMTAPIMKGIWVNSITQDQKPFIVMQMQCVDGNDVKLAIFYPPSEDYRFSWADLGYDYVTCPNFFNACFTHVDGSPVEAQADNFLRLQKIIKEGQGKDLRGVEWKIINLQATLNQLLGDYGPVDRLPECNLVGAFPTVDAMTDPIMRGEIIINHETHQEKKEYVAIKMRRLDTGAKEIYVLYQSSKGLPFEGPQTDSFQNTQRMIQEGKTTDRNSVKWEIIDHQKSKESNL